MRFGKKAVAALLALSLGVIPAGAGALAVEGEWKTPDDESLRVTLIAEVDDTYKSFTPLSAGPVDPKYDVTYKRLYFRNSYGLSSVDLISGTRGWHGGWQGTINTYKCRYWTN